MDLINKAQVALLAEGVGRNKKARPPVAAGERVALLAEGVGRNRNRAKASSSAGVALLAEGVGRNIFIQKGKSSASGRPPRGGRG